MCLVNCGLPLPISKLATLVDNRPSGASEASTRYHLRLTSLGLGLEAALALGLGLATGLVSVVAAAAVAGLATGASLRSSTKLSQANWALSPRRKLVFSI